uniref:NADH dehydrogenase subunit 5 n=1 Tax=Marcia hiantina TaxID=676960 RepID=UPI002237BD1A|nr:NADH dehydrogenase subunit 5 [Marcia hiantina]UYR95090.1 NADH dehydrogenase subunit 5 [Marcia hiantina]
MNSFVGSAVLMYFLGCMVFIIILLKMGFLNGGALVMEWEMSDKMVGEMGLCMVVDWVSCLFLASVLFISGCVSLFSGFYMAHESFLGRFTHILQAFVMSMMLLVLFPGYLGMMIGWDGLGVVSFLLVVYYSNGESLSAGMITAISNRVGDVFFIIAIGVMSSYLSYSFLSGVVFSLPVLSMLLLLGSMTKSAQVPFSAWLPEAMAAPTPVSTLVHSSTLVTAGVYVLFRFSEYLGEVEKSALMVTSILTMILAGSSGMLETDMKKVVALSTLSQVGMMMFCLSVGSNVVAFFHLLVHAFFKALMFMCVGGIIFYSGGNQDARFLGGVWVKLPLTSSLLVFSNLSLMGFPFFSGFYSKEMIVGSFLAGSWSVVSIFLVFIALSLTAFYSIRMMTLVTQESNTCVMSHYKMESLFYMTSLMMMSMGAVISSVMMQKFYVGYLSVLFMDGLYFYKTLGMFSLMIINILMGLILFGNNSVKMFTKNFLSLMWFLKPLSGNVASSKFLVSASKFVGIVEMGWIRGYIWQNGMATMIFGANSKLRMMNFNFIGFILFYCCCFVVLVLY